MKGGRIKTKMSQGGIFVKKVNMDASVVDVLLDLYAFQCSMENSYYLT